MYIVTNPQGEKSEQTDIQAKNHRHMMEQQGEEGWRYEYKPDAPQGTQPKPAENSNQQSQKKEDEQQSVLALQIELLVGKLTSLESKITGQEQDFSSRIYALETAEQARKIRAARKTPKPGK